MPLPSAVPEFPVSDLRAAQHFYTTKMGFTVDWTYENEGYLVVAAAREICAECFEMEPVVVDRCLT
jgi:catechol 2,3-dioxygenase-like lactoylglutathione lyase family enzyme